MNRNLALFAGISLLLICGTALAHHGTNASYDAKKEVTLTGVVTQFNWHNPHAQLYFDVKEENGTVVSWGAELNSPGVLAREGWKKTEFKAGDVITITLNALRQYRPVEADSGRWQGTHRRTRRKNNRGLRTYEEITPHFDFDRRCFGCRLRTGTERRYFRSLEQTWWAPHA